MFQLSNLQKRFTQMRRVLRVWRKGMPLFGCVDGVLAAWNGNFMENIDVVA